MNKHFVLLVMMLFPLFANAQKKPLPRNILIKGKVTQTSDYCGGAQPTPEILKNLATPEPLAGKTLYIKAGRINRSEKPVFKRVVTDEQGNFFVTLRRGMIYMFVEDWKGEPFKMPPNTDDVKWDQDCLKQRYEKADYVVNTKNKFPKSIVINFHKPCFFRPYCGEYSGPIPP